MNSIKECKISEERNNVSRTITFSRKTLSAGLLLLFLCLGMVCNNSYGGEECQLSNGHNPCAAASENGTVVEVYESSTDSESLCYKVGAFNSDNETISWGQDVKDFTQGSTPNLAIKTYDGQDVAVLVYHSATWISDKNLYYKVGVVDTINKTIDWGEAASYVTGSFPAVAMSTLPDLGFYVSEIHSLPEEQYNAFYYMTGVIDLNSKTISWMCGEQQLDATFNGKHASIAFSKNKSRNTDEFSVGYENGDKVRYGCYDLNASSFLSMGRITAYPSAYLIEFESDGKGNNPSTTNFVANDMGYEYMFYNSNSKISLMEIIETDLASGGVLRESFILPVDSEGSVVHSAVTHGTSILMIYGYGGDEVYYDINVLNNVDKTTNRSNNI